MEEKKVIVIREFDLSNDRVGVEDVGTKCEVGSTKKLSLFTDLRGDPICRVFNSPAFLIVVNNDWGWQGDSGDEDDKGFHQDCHLLLQALQK